MMNDHSCTCTYCGRFFTCNALRVRHEVIHNKHQPYQCTVSGCTARFTQSGTRNRHSKYCAKRIQIQRQGKIYTYTFTYGTNKKIIKKNLNHSLQNQQIIYINTKQNNNHDHDDDIHMKCNINEFEQNEHEITNQINTMQKEIFTPILSSQPSINQLPSNDMILEHSKLTQIATIHNNEHIEIYKYHCNICLSSYQRESHLQEHLQSNKHQYKQNKQNQIFKKKLTQLKIDSLQLLPQFETLNLLEKNKQQKTQVNIDINTNQQPQQHQPNQINTNPLQLQNDQINTNIQHNLNEPKNLFDHQQNNVNTNVNLLMLKNINISDPCSNSMIVNKKKNFHCNTLPSISISSITLNKLIYPSIPSNDCRSMIYQIKCNRKQIDKLLLRTYTNTQYQYNSSYIYYALKTPNPWNLITTKNEILNEAKIFYSLQQTSASSYIRRVIGTYGDGVIYEWAKYSLQELFENKYKIKYLKKIQTNLKSTLLLKLSK
jgi:hypothetical protein